jgi:hypothetical protein
MGAFDYRFLRMAHAYIIEGSDGKLWLPLSEIPLTRQRGAHNLEMVQVEDRYYDVQGYSITRKSLWLKPIIIEGAADNIDAELSAYLSE